MDAADDESSDGLGARAVAPAAERSSEGLLVVERMLSWADASSSWLSRIVSMILAILPLVSWMEVSWLP